MPQTNARKVHAIRVVKSAPLVSRRAFVAGSAAAATAATLTFSRDKRATAYADVTASVQMSAGGISAAAFKKAQGRAQALVARMTLAEVTRQMVNGTPALPKLGLPHYGYWAEALHGENIDGPVTSFPQPIALGCTWNPSLVHRVYSAVSDEARAFHNKTGYGLTFFSPATVNMGLRDPRWGRVEENFSEDPRLVQILAVQATRGMQGTDANYLKTISCAKHYICNDTDSDRDYADAAPDRRSFWEYYTRGFEAAVKDGKVFSVMAAYNSVWGIPCAANRMLLTELLRERWGFEGYVVSDCDAVADIYRTHHYVHTPAHAAALAVEAGMDLNCGNTYSQSLGVAVQQGLVSEKAVRAALVRVLTGRFLLGEFDPPAQVPWHNLSARILENHVHRDLARDAARQSLVLLKNDHALLPLDKTKLKSVAVIGPMAGACRLGGYSGRATYLVSPLVGIADALGSPRSTSHFNADDYLSTSNFRGPVREYGPDGSATLVRLNNNSWAQFGPADFTGKTSLRLRISAVADIQVMVHLDSLDGKPALNIPVAAGKSLSAWRTVEVALTGCSGRHIVFLKIGSRRGGEVANLKWFALAPESARLAGAVDVLYAPGCTITGDRNQALFDAAVEAARKADIALLFIGDNRRLSDEGRDRTFLHLPGVQHELAKAVLAANPRTVVVVNSTCPVAINWEQANVPAILSALYAGEQQGNAIADVLLGDYNPGGKLCSTWYQSQNQLPNFHDYDIKHGRTYMYFGGQPLYPFGHGLSYTTFKYGALRTSARRLQPGKPVHVSLQVQNTGAVAGDEVVQFYIHVNAGPQRPHKQLVGFERIHLKPGQRKTVAFVLRHQEQALWYWNDSQSKFAINRGSVDLLIGSSSADIHLHDRVALDV
ncbi:MAG: carbohydrate-binding protein [Phycisphaerales bacterium]|nr:carbohydrate-binding protein [Phycisphaerales bacterium]